MNRNSSVNNIIVTWWCDSAAFLSCVSVIAMLLSLCPILSHATDRLPDYLKIVSEENHAYHYRTNNLGFLTAWPLFLVADSDNSSSVEDIIFAFDGGYNKGNPEGATERMRLTDEGRLGIGTWMPEAQLDVRYLGPRHSYGSAPIPSRVSYSDEASIARFGLTKPVRVHDLDDNADYYGLNIKVHGSENHEEDGGGGRGGIHFNTAVGLTW